MRTTDAALRWLATARDPARPLFLWVHYIDPHGPYQPPDDATVVFHHDFTCRWTGTTSADTSLSPA